MKRIGTLALVLLSAVACGDSGTNPSANPNVATFTAVLLPQNEVPAITNADASASGVAQIKITVTRDSAGTITAATGDFTINVTGFPANTTLTGAHIHNNVAGQNAPVSFNTGVTTADTVPTGQATIIKNGVAMNPFNAANMQAILDNPAGAYFNVHTTINTGGAIRGQLSKVN